MAPSGSAAFPPGSLREWFERAMDQPPDARAAWIEAQVADPDLRRRLSRLVAAADAGGALDAPATARVAGLAAAAEHPAESLLGQRFAGFRLVRVIGRGGMATVFLGEREGADFEQRAAIKLLRRGLYSELEQNLFQRERRLLAQLSHPNIARLIDGGVTAAAIPFLVLEYVDGEPITRHAESRGLGRDARLRLMVEVCRAVAAAHRALIVHRDLKPANILVDRDGRVKLLDFGIAKLLSDAEPAATSRPTGAAMLTPGYAAPEQFEGRAVTMATDVHALGVILHELVHGELPGAAHEPRVLPGTRRAGRRRTHGDLDKILDMALAPDPDARYADAAALADDIGNFLAARPVRAHPPSGWYRVRRFVDRHRGGVLASLLLLGGMLGSFGFALWQAGAAREQARRAEGQAARAEEVQGFIEALFASVADGQAPASQVTVLELVERATTRIEQAYPDDPATRAALLALFARIQYALGNYERNRVLAADALRANVEAFGELDPRSIDAAFVHAHVLRRIGEGEAALAEFSAWRDRLRAAGIRGFDLARMLDGISMVRMEQEVPGEEAIALKREILEERELDPGLTPEERATGYNNLGAAHQYAGDLAGALEWYGKARDINRERRPGSQPFAVNLLNVGMVLGYLGRWREAQPVFAEGVAVLDRIARTRHPTYASLLSQQCMVESELEDFAAARGSCGRAVALTREILGETHRGSIYALTRRALLAYNEGRLEDGDADLEAAWRAVAASREPRPYDELVIRSAHARGLMLRGEAAALRAAALEALELSRNASRKGPAAGPAEPGLIAYVLWSCAVEPAPECGGHDAAFVLELLEGPRFAASAQRLAIRVVLSEAALAARDPQQVIDLLEGFEPEFEAALGPGHSQIGRAHLALARAYETNGDPGRAEPHRARAQEIARALPSTHPLRESLADSPHD